MALDGDAGRVLEMVRLSGRPPFETISPAQARALFLGGREILSPDPAPVAETRELTVAGPNAGRLALRLYRCGSTAAPALRPGRGCHGQGHPRRRPGARRRRRGLEGGV